MKHCCPDFLKAREFGTDNEGYGSLINIELFPTISGTHRFEWIMGDGLPIMNFCPWCGTSLRTPSKEDFTENEKVMFEPC